MKSLPAQNLLVAHHGKARVTIGLDAPETLRELSDARSLTCPGCGGVVILHAGAVRAHHFAHLPGAACSLPVSEPETEEHRAGKLLIAEWLRDGLSGADVRIEAFLPETNQRADVLAVLPDRSRIALEYQCAPLTAREWRRRHRQYRDAGIRDLWLLGGSRFIALAPAQQTPVEDPAEIGAPNGKTIVLRTAELERTLLSDGAPLLFLDSIGENMPIGTLARFRPDPDAQAHRPQGQRVTRALRKLPFPFHLLDWPERIPADSPVLSLASAPVAASSASPAASEFWLWQWLGQRYQVTPETLPAFFGLGLNGEEAFSCRSAAWQAAIYYRFVHRRIGDSWWLNEVETWARGYLPLARPLRVNRLRAALTDYQQALAAAGMLSPSHGLRPHQRADYRRSDHTPHPTRPRGSPAPGPLPPHARPRKRRRLRQPLTLLFSLTLTPTRHGSAIRSNADQNRPLPSDRLCLLLHTH